MPYKKYFYVMIMIAISSCSVDYDSKIMIKYYENDKKNVDRLIDSMRESFLEKKTELEDFFCYVVDNIKYFNNKFSLQCEEKHEMFANSCICYGIPFKSDKNSFKLYCARHIDSPENKFKLYPWQVMYPDNFVNIKKDYSQDKKLDCNQKKYLIEQFYFQYFSSLVTSSIWDYSVKSLDRDDLEIASNIEEEFINLSISLIIDSLRNFYNESDGYDPLGDNMRDLLKKFELGKISFVVDCVIKIDSNKKIIDVLKYMQCMPYDPNISFKNILCKLDLNKLDKRKLNELVEVHPTIDDIRIDPRLSFLIENHKFDFEGDKYAFLEYLRNNDDKIDLTKKNLSYAINSFYRDREIEKNRIHRPVSNVNYTSQHFFPVNNHSKPISPIRQVYHLPHTDNQKINKIVEHRNISNRNHIPVRFNYVTTCHSPLVCEKSPSYNETNSKITGPVRVVYTIPPVNNAQSVLQTGYFGETLRKYH